MIILSLWLYRLEHDEEAATEDELKMYEKVRQLFEQDVEEAFATQLSSIVARLWGSMLDEVVVWGYVFPPFPRSFHSHYRGQLLTMPQYHETYGRIVPSPLPGPRWLRGRH